MRVGGDVLLVIMSPAIDFRTLEPIQGCGVNSGQS